VTQMYSFPLSRMAWMIFVASSRAMGNMPVTFGSSVPPCPASFMVSIRFSHAVTSWLEGPEGLSRLIIPKRI